MLGVNDVPLAYDELNYAKKKYVQFCLAGHNDDLPLFPILPIRLASLLRFAWWLQDQVLPERGEHIQRRGLPLGGKFESC